MGLLQDTGAAWEQPLPERERTEACFKISLDYWIRLKELVAKHPFGDEQEEIISNLYICAPKQPA